MARDYDWKNISKAYTVLSQRVIITRSRDRKIRSCERNYDRRRDFPKRVRLGVLGYRLMVETLSEINIFCSCSHAPLRRERLVRRYWYRLHGLHRFDETFPRNITFLSIELNAHIHPRGLRFSIVESSPPSSYPPFIVFPLAAGRRLSAKRLILQRVENPGITANVDLW